MGIVDNKVVCSICGNSEVLFQFTKNNFDIFRCNQCAVIFTHIPDSFNLESIYDQSYFQGGQEDGYGNYLGTEEVLRKEFKKSVKTLRKLTDHQDNLRLLELGSAYGFFLDEAQSYFQCTGIEVSEEAAKFSQDRGHEVIHGVLDANTASHLGKFDIVTMFDVIEHLPDPVQTLNYINEILNPNGLIMVTTGDVDSILSKIMRQKWRLMAPPQHTFFFSKRTLGSIFENMNYSIEIIDRPWKLIPLSLVAYQVGRRAGIRLRFLEHLDSANFPVNLFDTVRVVAKRR